MVTTQDLSWMSVEEYLLIEQDLPAVTVYRGAGDEFLREVISGLEAIVPAPEIGTELLLSGVYGGTTFP